MSRSLRRSSAFALGALLLASAALVGCAAPVADPGWPPQQTNFELTPVPISSQVAVGPNRMLFNILDKQNQSIASPDTSVELRFYDLATSKTEAAVDDVLVEYLPTIEGRPGLYRAQVEFPKGGDWGVDATATYPDASKHNGRFVFSVLEEGTTPAIGGDAVESDTPTATTAEEIAAISTDDDPDPDFYKQSVSDALAAHEPFALVFATPAFCASAMCAPMLDSVKAVAAQYKDRMTFIHVEPYELQMVDGSLQPVLDANNLPISVQSTVDWGLPTEPYIFVVDDQGKVIAKFEGVASSQELGSAFDLVVGN